MRYLMLLACVCMTFVGLAQSDFEMPLYANGAQQKDIQSPKIRVFLPVAAKATSQVVVVCPGGGYGGLAFDHEGIKVAQWLNDLGVAAVVLWYRMPNQQNEIPLADLHRAITITRENAVKWNINPQKLGVMGFSAGGHLASTASTHFTESTRPNFSILIYPVITMGDFTHAGSRHNLIGDNPSEELVRLYSNELQVTSQTPPTFLALSDDDTAVVPLNSTTYYNALKRAGVPAELHIYPKGGHGWGFRDNWQYKDEFRNSLSRWLSEIR